MLYKFVVRFMSLMAHGDKYYTAAVMDTHPTLYKSAWYSPNRVFHSFDDGIYYHENYVFV